MPTRFDFDGLAHVGPVTPNYPMLVESYGTDGELERVQVQYDEHRFGFILKHPILLHWCGYVLLPQSMPALFGRFIGGVYVTYASYSTSSICWMEANLSDRLTHPVILTEGAEDDYWVGFDFMQRSLTGEQALEALNRFEIAVVETINGSTGA